MPTIVSNMGFRKIIKRISNTTVQTENPIWSSSSTSKCIDKSYRKAVRRFIDRRRSSSELASDAEFYSYQPIKQNGRYLLKKDSNRNCHNNSKWRKYSSLIPGVPHVEASEIFEIGCVAGTEDRYLELISAEWHNTRVSLKRHTHPDCQGAIKADIEVLTEIRHPNVLLLMAMTHTDDHGLVSIFESVNFTLYNFIHEQRERMSIQNVAQIGMKLADALKYCHMRGYIHGAVSSHCVYFVPNGGVKLGGWELATFNNVHNDGYNTQRNYKELLRMEIFKWQAPEFFYGLCLSTKSDVYGLSLLLWEMSTARKPWDGCNQPHVELQYTLRTRSVIADLDSFPPRLQKVLENGLQLDATKRTLDMDKIRKTLYRLIVSAEAEPTYVNLYYGTLKLEETNNIKNIRKSSPKFTPSYENIMLIKKSPADKLDCMTQDKLTNRSFTSTMIQCNRDLDENIIEKDELLNTNSKERLTTEIQTTDHDIHTKYLSKVKEHEIDEELHNTTRSDIQRLKEINASRRKHFFNENKLSFASSAPNSIRTNKNTDYVLCKPASHATNMQIKFTKPLGEHQENKLKPSNTTKLKTSYINTPENIKETIAQCQVLHSNAESFYESILWRKEKLICLSRMGRETNNNNICQRSWPLLPKSFIDVNSRTDNNETQHLQINSAKNNKTSIVKDALQERADKRTKNVEESLSKNTQGNNMSTRVLNFSNNPLHDLKSTIDHATEITHSGTQYENVQYENSQYLENSVPYSQDYYNFEINADDAQKYEIVLEDLHRTKNSDNNQFSVVEKSSGISLLDNYVTAKSNIGMGHKGQVTRDLNYNTYDAKCPSKLICETTEVDSNGSQTSMQNQQMENVKKLNLDEGARTNAAASSHKTGTTNFEKLPTNGVQVCNYWLRPFNSARCKICSSYDFDDLRRRSLPARLNHLKNIQSPGFKIIHTHKNYLRGSNCTIEDFYIDDEFGSRLNDNLILLNDSLQSCVISDYPYDGHHLPQTTEL